MTRQDKRAEVQIELQGEHEWDGPMIVPPGATISGEVDIMPTQDIKCNHLLIQLKWYTEGKGDLDEQVIDQMDIRQGVLPAGNRISESFTFNLPDQPWSYSGHYVNVIWAVAVKIDIPLARDVNYSYPFVMTPDEAKVTPEPAPDSIW